MNKKYWLPLFVALLVSALPAKAQTWDYHFGTQLSGDVYQPSTTFAYMSVSTTNNLSFDFILRAFDTASGGGTLASAFGSSAFIGKAIFNSVSGADPISITNIQTNGYVRTVTMNTTSANVGGVGFDFADCFGGNSCSHGGDLGRLQSGEWVSWTLNFAAPQTPLLGTPPVALHVQSWGPGNENSGWYTPTTPVPEPETYAMLLAGLGLLAFARKRRNRAMPVAAA